MSTDKILFFTCTILISIGIVFSLSLSAFAILYYDNTNKLHFFLTQLLIAVIGITFMWLLSKPNPDKYLSYIGFFLFFSMFILMIVMPFLPSSIVREVNGANRWIKIAGFSLSPVEFFKIGFIYFLAWSFTRKIDSTKKTIAKETLILLPYVFVFIIVMFIVAYLQNDLGQIFVLGLVFVMMTLFAGASFRILGTGILFIFLSIYIFIKIGSHRSSRIESWWAGIQDHVLKFFPEHMQEQLRINEADAPYQVSNSLNAINNGGMFGEGLGFGTIKLGFLSDVHTDFVLAGIAEEIGFIGILFIVILFFIILFRLFKIALRSQNNVYYLFSLGIGFMFLFTFVVNAFGITSLIPMKGIAVPFLSYGGSHLLASCFAIGLILMISKKSKMKGGLH
ncbi:cell division protein, FtsW/RodA/SpoVE family [Campylobacter blaseri]|uniref:Probable peptidoglycan glycosyltransferase FtsW n=1 Tax=Campylobacter blaseri TaxID=2042961 RepID=A0A2P8R2L8_9BACT|nr:FtsW/RodA/SpoVE family cell cycle protein [Campylobacter blaseri]PSM52708.1 cell division protein [Campylobacter blaseri]PSM54356.1 cell division protein [Campylobacter blaseri]QKF86009.1 cell division protein, FtsW/RodA/SpoVE family [Campylobacter blaseri]